MKKIITICLAVFLLSTAANAQRTGTQKTKKQKALKSVNVKKALPQIKRLQLEAKKEGQ